MSDSSYLDWPFRDESHRELARSLADSAAREAVAWAHPASPDVDAACVARVRRLGALDWLRHTVPAPYGGTHPVLDVRSLCIARETLAYHDGLADFAFAMQGLGSGPISLYGSAALRERYLPRVARGELIAAFPSPSPTPAATWCA